MNDYAVVFERADDGSWSAYAPDVPGVVAAAGTRDEAEVRMREALQLYGEELARQGESPPTPRSEIAVIRA
jgi:predicted RNase H-like HicB family nuclease